MKTFALCGCSDTVSRLSLFLLAGATSEFEVEGCHRKFQVASCSPNEFKVIVSVTVKIGQESYKKLCALDELDAACLLGFGFVEYNKCDQMVFRLEFQLDSINFDLFG